MQGDILGKSVARRAQVATLEVDFQRVVAFVTFARMGLEVVQRPGFGLG